MKEPTKTVLISEKETIAHTEAKKEALLREGDFKITTELPAERTDAILKGDTPPTATIPTNHSEKVGDTTPQDPRLQTQKTD